MSELLVIGIVALIVIGPKDLPEMFRQLGRFTAKMRAMARDFSRAMEQAANETGVSDVAKDLHAVANPKAMGMNAVKDAVDKFERWDPIKNAAKPTEPLRPGGPLVPPPMPPMVKPAPEVVALTETATETATETTTKAAGNAAPAPAPAAPPPKPAMGPNTAALYEKKAAKEAIVKEAAAKLRALDTAPQAPAPKAASARRSKVADETGDATGSKAAPKAPRKKKAAEE